MDIGRIAAGLIEELVADECHIRGMKAGIKALVDALKEAHEQQQAEQRSQSSSDPQES